MIRLRLNHLLIKPHQESDFIKAKWFFKMLETNDLRFILNYNKLPRLPVYDQRKLIEVYDKLYQEFDKILKRYDYSEYYAKEKSIIRKKVKFTVMRACYHLLRLGKTEAIDYLKTFKINIKDCSNSEIMRLKNLITLLNTEIQMIIVRRASIKKIGQDSAEGIYMRNIVAIENTLERSIDADNISLKKYCVLMNSANLKNKYLENLKNKYGRNNKQR